MTIFVKAVCKMCRKEEVYAVKEEDFSRWTRKLIHAQEAFPYLTPGEREMLISGTCDACWKVLFKEEEKDEQAE